MQTVTLPLDQIRAGERIRRPREARVAAIAAAIAAEGQREPLEVSPGKDGAYDLVAGAVRLAALEQLGLDALCVVIKASKAERRAREIDANLMADGLTVLERARYLAAAKADYEATHPETAHGGTRRGTKSQILRLENPQSDQVADQIPVSGICQPKFVAWAAGRWGRSERTVEGLVAIGRDIDAQAADAIADSIFADKTSELANIARLEPQLQRQVATILTRAENPATCVADAVREASEKALPRQLDLFDKFTSSVFPRWWGKINSRNQKIFVAQLVRQIPREWVEQALAEAAEDKAVAEATETPRG